MKVAARYFEEITTEDSFGYVSPIIYLQGCSIKCEGCHNKSLWIPGEGKEVTKERILQRISQSAFEYKAVTFQGGEPLDQMSDLLWLLHRIQLRGTKTIVYTGHIWEEIPTIVKCKCDILKCGPYGSDQSVYYRIPLLKTVPHFQYKEVKHAIDNE